ncbi:hypothetical protein [Arthrobacter sp. SLBN-122]|uniref:hypothetical protein n=1 Tax=Arthrobacter sp. SLBN-122 TaxID=2768455 RepID=UPI00114F68F9|nr:hypothetical protein [Arthrobacter sp. SLBN-122]TQJ35578.1 hypothetical protein FBY36_2851 [Arthrobacter sp. SLBN-122]
MFSKSIHSIGVLTGVLALFGCAGSTTDATPAVKPTPTPTVSAPPADGGTYATVTALKAAFVKAGGACPDFKQTNKITLAAESAECSTNTVISTYVSSNDISQLIQTVKKLNADLKTTGGNSWLVGANWVINSPVSANMQEKLGGKIVSF